MAQNLLKNLSYLNKFAQKLRDYRLNMYAKEVRTPQYKQRVIKNLSLIHISEPTRPY